jgi:hypothetical protein
MSKAEEMIPQNVQDFAKAFTSLAAEYRLSKAHITLSFGWGKDRVWDTPITIDWEEGRHGEDAKRFLITTTLSLRSDLARSPGRG